jgi:hypothetical protein
MKAIGKSGGQRDMKRGLTRLYKKFTGLPAKFKPAPGLKCHGRLKLSTGQFEDFKGHWIEVDKYFLIKIADGRVFASTGGGFLYFDLLEFHLGEKK